MTTPSHQPQASPSADLSTSDLRDKGTMRIVWETIILVSSLVVAYCFLLPQIAPSHDSVASVVWLELESCATSFSLPTDAMVFTVLALVFPYLLAFLLACSAMARLLNERHVSRICRASLWGSLVFVGAGIAWALPCLWLDEVTWPEQAGSFSSGVVLSLLVLWGARRVGKRQIMTSGWPSAIVSFGCTVWFCYLLITVPVELGVYLSCLASLCMTVAHSALAAGTRILSLKPVLASGPLTSSRSKGYSISLEY